MVKHHTHTTVQQQSVHVQKLIVLNLHLSPQAQVSKALKQGGCVGIKVGAQQRHIESHTHDTLCLQILQFRRAGIVGNHGHALVAATALGQSIEQAAVIQAITRVGSDDQRVTNMVRVQQVRQLHSGPSLRWQRAVTRIGTVGEARRIKYMNVAINGGFDGHGDKKIRSLYPTLPTHVVVLQLTPSVDLH